MRIAIVTTSYPADGDDGAGCFVRAEALRLRERAEIHVICPGPAVRDPGVIVHAVGGGAVFGWPSAAAKLRGAPWLAPQVLRFAAAARRRLARLAPSHVQAHWLVPAAFPIASGFPSIEAVAHGGDLRLLLALPRSAREVVLEAAMGRRGTIRFVSAEARRALLGSLGEATRRALELRSYVEPCALGPIDARDRTRLRRELEGMIGDGELACVVGRLVPSKRIALALEAIAAAGMRAIVVGDGPERDALVRAFPAVRFLGKLPRSRTLDVVAASDILVDASAAEGAPTAIREARALGVPVVSCGAGDVARWARHDPGISVARPSELASALRSRRLAGAAE